MRSTLIYIWLISTLLPTLSQWGTIAYYQINKEYITKVLCKNRDRPELHCNGRCDLAKRLNAQQAKKDQQTSDQVQNLPVVQLFASPVLSFQFYQSSFRRNPELSFAYKLMAYQAHLSVTVPPPCQA
ncbi:MAG TPA: hypothetical protein VGN64_00765 [Dyadobacter sp.]|jgi:hypothetical protein|nr:hypothetical protein [Dyadobacter sp.]